MLDCVHYVASNSNPLKVKVNSGWVWDAVTDSDWGRAKLLF